LIWQSKNTFVQRLIQEQKVMLRFDTFLKDPYAEVFNPKVTPDPRATERLDAKLQEATQRLRSSFSKHYAQRAMSWHRPTSA
jgi:hypothetical protein